MKTRKVCRPAGLDDKVINISATVLAAIVLMVTLYPLIFVISASFSNPDEIAAGNIVLFPRGWTLDGYALVFEDESIWTGYRNTIFYTIFGTALNMLFTLPCAYALSRRDLKGRTLIMKLFTFTMFFSGGMIPKVECCINAIRWGVNRVFIIDGRIPHAILIEMLTNEGIGTMFTEGLPTLRSEGGL